MTVPPLPHRPAPTEGESAESYIERLAYVNGQVPARLLAYLGFGHYDNGGLRTTSRNTPTFEQITALASAASIGQSEAAAMFPTAVLGPLVLHAGSNWFHATSSNLCPSCLAEGQGWRLEWRFAWTMLCTRHQRFLVSTCPSCEQPIRKQSPLPHSNVCDNRGGRQACGQRLDQLTPGPSVDDDRLLVLQDQITRATDALANNRDDTGTAKNTIHEFLATLRYLEPSDQIPPVLYDASTTWFKSRGRAKFAPPPLVTAALALTAIQ